MVQRNYLTISSLLLLTLLLSSCGYLRKPEKEIIVQTVEVQKVIPVQPQPKPIDMTDVKFYVVTEENYDEFKEKFMKRNNDFVFYVVSVHDYENLALNMSELYRYIKQQKEIVIYYEKAVTDKPEEPKVEIKK
jgi:leucyl aminopeptidase (aminopeptidase T)